MNYRQNTGFSSPSSNLSKNTQQNPKSLQASRYTQRPLQQTSDREGSHTPNQAYRVQNFPDQVGFDELVERKEVLHQLLKQFSDKNSAVVFQPYKKEQYSKRLMLLEQQIEGLMRQSYMYATKNPGQRTLDYTSLISEKQNQVNQLQRKISYLETQLRMKDQRQQQLEKQLERRFDAIKNKNDQIEKLKGIQTSYNDTSKYPNEAVNNQIRKLMASLDNLLRKSNSSPNQLENQVQGWIMGLPKQSILKRKIRQSDQNWLQDKYKRYVSAVTTEAASMLNSIQKLYTTQIMNLKSSGAPVDYQPKIMQIIGRDTLPSQFFPTQSTLTRTKILNQLSSRPLLLSQSPQKSKYFNNVSRVSVQVPVQDARTKALIKKLALEMRRLYTKYPKLASEISPELSEYLSQQILDVIEVDELDRLVEIVKYKPDIVKVENVYAFNSDKNRRVQFHLKVLIKALLQEMEKMKIKTGVQPQIDEGVIGMIRQQVMDVVDVDDILRVYRVVPKIVEVEKVVEQVVQKIVTVPHFVTVHQNETKVVPISNVQVVKDLVNVPLQINVPQPLIQQKLVLGNQYSERIVPKPMIEQNSYETVTQVPRVRQVDRIVQAPVEVVKTVQIEGPQKIVPLQRPVIHELIRQKIVPVERVVERVVEVQKIIQKIVQVIKEVPKIITVDRVVQKLVPQIQYVESQRVENYVVEKPVEVICQVQKIVPIEKIVERVVSYPQIVEKLVPVVVRQQVIKQIQIIKEVPVYQKQLIVQDRIVQKMAEPILQQVPVPVDRIVQIPFIHEKVRVETQYRKQPVIQRQHTLQRQAVRIEVPVILTEQKILQIEKPMIQILRQEVPRQIIKQRLIPVQHYRDQLVPTPFIVEKIIQRLVEVPRVVEVERIVQKIVPIPRIIEKIVEVEKIVEKIVEKNIYHTNIQPVEYLTEVPIEVESVVTIQIPKYIYHSKQIAKVIEIPVPVVSQVHTESVRVQQIQQPPRVAIERMQVPLELIKEKIVSMRVQEQVVVQLKQQIIVPMEMPVPTTLIEQRIVPVQQIVPLIQAVDKVREKLVEVQVQSPGQLIVKDRIVQKLFVQNQVKVVQNQIPYYNDRFKQIEVVVEKVVPVERIVQQIREVPHIIQKIVHSVNEVPKVYQVDKIIQVPVKETELITIDRIVPKIVTLNKAFAQIVDKLHEFPRLAQEMKQVEKRLDNIVIERHGSTEIQQAQVLVEKAVIQQKLKQVDKYINVINQSLQVVDRIVEKPTDPIIIYQQKILQVPVIVQKLAERIVIMPQVVQVLKYIHEVTDNDSLGIAVSSDIGVQQAEYQRLGKIVNREVSNLRNLLMNLKNSPQFRNNVTIIDNFLIEFNKFLAYPRLRQVMTEKVVQNILEKDRIVRVPTRSAEDERKSLASAVLIDKLLNELKRVRLSNPNVQMNLDPEIVQIFGSQLEPVSSKYGNNYNQLLEEYERAIFNKFNSYGAFTQGHQLMLRQFIDERFELANRLKKLSKDSTKYKELYNGLNEKFNRQYAFNEKVRQRFGDIQNSIKGILITIVDIGVRNSIEEKLRDLNEAIFGYAMASDTPVYRVGQVDDDRVSRYVREKDTQIIELKRIIDGLKRQIESKTFEQKAKVVYSDCPIHTKTISELQSQIVELKKIISINSNTTTRISEQTKYQGEIERLNSELYRLREQLNRSLQQANRYKEELTRSKEQFNRMKQELFRLRQIQKLHLQCNGIIASLKKRIADLEREVKSNRKTQAEDYGKNFQDYIDLNNSRQSSAQSIASDSSRGVYRSANGYTGNYAGGYKGQKTGSMEHMPQGTYNSVDVRGSGFNNEVNSKSNGEPAQNMMRVEGRQLAFSKKASSVKSSSESGGSSGLYGTSSKEVTKRVQNKQEH